MIGVRRLHLEEAVVDAALAGSASVRWRTTVALDCEVSLSEQVDLSLA
jgi:hypothetical protein